MEANAVFVLDAEPFGLDDRRDILGEITLQEGWQNFLPAAWPSRDDDQARRTTPGVVADDRMVAARGDWSNSSKWPIS